MQLPLLDITACAELRSKPPTSSFSPAATRRRHESCRHVGYDEVFGHLATKGKTNFHPSLPRPAARLACSARSFFPVASPSQDEPVNGELRRTCRCLQALGREAVGAYRSLNRAGSLLCELGRHRIDVDVLYGHGMQVQL